MEKEFEIYISEVVGKVDCSKEEQSEIAEEIQDHLILLKREFLDKGYSEVEAVKLAISTFGNEKKISNELQDAMFPYLKVVKWLGIAFCGLLSVLMINKGISLWNMGANVDGTGIGIHFLGMELNDRVPEASITKYAVGFFITSILPILVAFVLVGDTFMKSRKQVTNN